MSRRLEFEEKFWKNGFSIVKSFWNSNDDESFKIHAGSLAKLFRALMQRKFKLWVISFLRRVDLYLSTCTRFELVQLEQQIKTLVFMR